MIAKLTGILDSVTSDCVVVDVGGVGYSVNASVKTLGRLPQVGEKASLLIEHIIRQDHQQLCGFYDENERQCFRSLLGVQGVGVKVALSILSVLTPDELLSAIVHQDKTMLTRAEGVGPKVAGRIVLELKDKKLGFLSDMPSSIQEGDSSLQDALQGLIGLGYSRSEAAGALSKVVQGAGAEAAPSTLIRLALQTLAARG